MVTLIRSGLLLLLLLSGCGWDGTPTRENDFVPLTSIEISADYSTIAGQTSTRLTVIGNFSGLITKDITDQVVWSSDAPTVAKFDPAKSPNRVFGLAPGTAILTATVRGVKNTFTLTVSSATLASMTITADKLSIAKGLSTKFIASGIFSDSTTQDLTFDAAWTSSAPTVATVSDAVGSKGFTQAIAAGTATITATFGGFSDSKLLTVTEPVLQSITISPTNPSILSLSTGSFKATGHYSDGSTPDITGLVAWSSSQSGIATIATSGAATTITQGTTSINAALNGINGTTNLKVTGGNLTGITVTPATVTLVKDTTTRDTIASITATGTFNNGGTVVSRDITGVVQWTVADTSRATVTPSGGNLALLNPLAVTVVPTTITASSGSQSSPPVTLTIIARQLRDIAPIALSATILDLTAGTSSPLTVSATFSDGTIQDVTTLCEWTTDDNTKATVGTSGHAAGRVTGIATGSAKISATYDGKPAVSATVSVLSRVLQSLTVSPATSTVTAGQQVSYTAVASYFDLTTKDVTEDATWSIDNPNVAILADKVNQPGQVVAVDRGSANLTASFGGKTPTQTTTITVAGP